MNASRVTAISLVLAVGGALLYWSARPAPPSLPVESGAVEQIDAASTARPSAARTSTRALLDPGLAEAAARAAVVEELEAPAAAPPPPIAAPPERVLRGRVLDPEARPMVGVELLFEPRSGAGDATQRARATSGPAGRFELTAPRSSGDVRAADSRLTTVLGARVRAQTEVGLLVVVAPHRRLAGRVVDEGGAPLDHARVALEEPPGFRGRFEAVLDAVQVYEWVVRTDAGGAFELGDVPVVDGSSVVATLEGFVTASTPAPFGEHLGLELVLARPDGAAMLAGRVVNAENVPVPGALVSLGGTTVTTDGNGEFRIDASEPEDARELVALHPGHLPARERAQLDPDTGRPAWPEYVVLDLGAAPLSLGGVVVDPGGEPRPGLRLWLHEPTAFGVHRDDMVAHVEYLLAAEEPDERDGYFESVETDAEGRFRVPGLLERDYELRVMDPDTLQTIRVGPFAAGDEDLRVVFERVEGRPLSGRVVTRSGEALAGVQVDLYGATFGGVWERGGGAATDAEGRFRFEGVGGDDLMLWLRGDDVVPRTHHVDGAPEGELELVLEARCHLKVDLAHAPGYADRLYVLDAAGKRLDTYLVGPGGVTTTGDLRLPEGRSVTFGVADSASTLVLLEGTEIVRRIPLSLRPRELNVIVP